jgi:hypothetical protein
VHDAFFLGQGLVGLVFFGAIFVGAIALYLLPTIIAVRRGKANTAAIALVNIFLGWTFIGWFVALLWAVSNQVVDAPAVVRAPSQAPATPASILCAHCGKYSAGGTKFCPHCGGAF